MHFNSKASYLPEKEWNGVALYLKPFAAEFSDLAKRLKLKFRCNQRWPALSLSGIKLRSINEFRLSLNRDYMQDGEFFFEFIHLQYSKSWLVKRRVIKSDVLTVYSLGELQNVQYVVNGVEEAIRYKLQ